MEKPPTNLAGGGGPLVEWSIPAIAGTSRGSSLRAGHCPTLGDRGVSYGANTGDERGRCAARAERRTRGLLRLLNGRRWGSRAGLRRGAARTAPPLACSSHGQRAPS